jgi:hypothetical protein
MSTRSAHLRYAPRPVLQCAVHHAQRERDMRAGLPAFLALSTARRLGLRDGW